MMARTCLAELHNDKQRNLFHSVANWTEQYIPRMLLALMYARDPQPLHGEHWSLRVC